MTIAIANQQRIVPLDRKAIRALCTNLLRAHGVKADLSLCFVDDAAMRVLNTHYLGRRETTDVLAFPLENGDCPCLENRDSHHFPKEHLLGDVVISAEKALAEARRRRTPVARELALYTAHGVLHLLGYDDHTPAARRRMRRAERRALAAVSLPATPRTPSS